MKRLPANTALIVIDVQAAFDGKSCGPRNNPRAEANIARLLEAWRARGRTIIHVHHDGIRPASSFRIATPGHAPKPEAAPRAGEKIIHKQVNSAFIGTSLEADLRRSGIDSIVIVGLTTNHCVSTTARMAGNLGFDTVVVSDATASFDSFAIDGTRRAAHDVHIAALSDLNNEFADIAGTDEILDAMNMRDASLNETKPDTQTPIPGLVR